MPWLLRGALDLIGRAGGGVVKAYRQDTLGKRTSGSFLYNGTRSPFEKTGFSYERPAGKNHCAMRRTVSPPSLDAQRVTPAALTPGAFGHGPLGRRLGGRWGYGLVMAAAQGVGPAVVAGCGAGALEVPGDGGVGDGGGQVALVGQGVVASAEQGGIARCSLI